MKCSHYCRTVASVFTSVQMCQNRYICELGYLLGMIEYFILTEAGGKNAINKCNLVCLIISAIKVNYLQWKTGKGCVMILQNMFYDYDA